MGLTIWILALVWQKNEATRLGYQVAEALAEYRGMSSRIGDLEACVEKKFSPGSVARDASQFLGLVPPEISRLRFLETQRAHAEGYAEARRNRSRARLKG